MRKIGLRTKPALQAIVVLFGLGFAWLGSQAAWATLSTPRHAQPLTTSAPNPQQDPIMDAMANKVIQKYQQSTCEQLWQQKSQKNKPQSVQEQEAVSLLRSDPQMRAAFINKIAPPIANKMVDCGMIP